MDSQKFSEHPYHTTHTYRAHRAVIFAIAWHLVRLVGRSNSAI